MKMQIHQHGASVMCKTLTAMRGHGWRDVRNAKPCHQRQERGPVPAMSPPPGEHTLLRPSPFLSHNKLNCFAMKTKEQLRIHGYQENISSQMSF